MRVSPTVNPRSPRRPRPSALRREIAAVLVFKALILALLYLAFFGSSQRRDITAADVARLFAIAAPNQGKH